LEVRGGFEGRIAVRPYRQNRLTLALSPARGGEGINIQSVLINPCEITGESPENIS